MKSTSKKHIKIVDDQELKGKKSSSPKVKKPSSDKDLGEDLTMNEEAEALKKLSPDEEL